MDSSGSLILSPIIKLQKQPNRRYLRHHPYPHRHHRHHQENGWRVVSSRDQVPAIGRHKNAPRSSPNPQWGSKAQRKIEMKNILYKFNSSPVSIGSNLRATESQTEPIFHCIYAECLPRYCCIVWIDTHNANKIVFGTVLAPKKLRVTQHFNSIQVSQG